MPCAQVLGAVGRLVRIERCERVQLITAASRLIVSSCHDCIFYLGVNRAPLLIGDNRFIQARPAAATPSAQYGCNLAFACPGYVTAYSTSYALVWFRSALQPH